MLVLTGIANLAYGTAARFLIRHSETVKTSKGDVKVYFLYREVHFARY